MTKPSKGLILVLFLIQASQILALDQTKTYIKHAELYYWLGIQDYGDPKAFRSALSYLELAEKQLSRIGPEENENTEIQNQRSQINLLMTDTREQLSIAEKTFIGTFPLARFMGQSPFVSSTAFGSYEIFERAGEVAAARAANRLGGLFYSYFSGDLQVPMFVFSDDPSFPELESKVRVLLKHSPRIKVYQSQYLHKYLNNDEVHLLQAGQLSQQLIEKICKKLYVENFAVTTIRLANSLNNDYFFTFDTLIFGIDSAAPMQSTVVYELVRDRRHRNWVYFLCLLCLLVLSVTVYILSYKYNLDSFPGPKHIMYGPVMAFFAGLFTTMISLGIFYRLIPDYQAFFGYTFWWIPTAFIIIFLAPLFLIKKYILSLSIYQNHIDAQFRLPLLFVAASAGIMGFLSLGLLLYHDLKGILYIAIGVMSTGVVAFILGKASGNPKAVPSFLVLLASILLPVFGTAISSSSHANLMIPVAGTLGLVLIIGKTRTKERKTSLGLAVEPELLMRIDRFIRLTESPPFLKPDGFDDLLHKALCNDDNKVKIICLQGEVGTGKTCTAKHIIKELERIIHVEGKTLLLLEAQCPEKTDAPYLPMQQALIDVINLSGKEDASTEIEELENALDNLIGSFVPFSSLIKSNIKSNQPGFNSEAELFFMVFTSLKRLSKEHHLILFLDDLHWADNGTIKMLDYLQSSFTRQDKSQILFLYTARPSQDLEGHFSKQQIEYLKPLSEEKKLQLLTSRMGIETDSAKLILQWTGNHGSGKGELFWLYKILEQLARNNHFEETPQGLELSDTILSSQRLPVPDEYRLAIRDELNRVKDFEAYLAVAACVGIHFEVSVISQALDVGRLECLKNLQHIEEETNLIYDDPLKDDVFAFSSSFTLETIREVLLIQGSGPNVFVRQIVREYHARVARMLENLNPKANTVRIAKHYYAAGQCFADKAIHYLIKAAYQCACLFRFEEARLFLRKAKEEMQFANETKQYDLDILLVECEISMLEGSHLEETAMKCSAYVDKNPNTLPEHQLIFARAFYNARRFQLAVQTCTEVINICNQEHSLAIAHHLIGISLEQNLSTKRLAHLEKSLLIISSISNQTAEEQKTHSAIHNSLGEEYTRMTRQDPKHKQSAIKHFEESIRIKRQKHINDTPGIARSFGGLGRLELYVSPVKVERALEYFEKDLELSIQIGDLLGQTQMYSNIGKCSFLLKQYEKSITSYRHSLALAERSSDKAFALFGLLQAYDLSKNNVEIEVVIDELASLIHTEKSDLPEFLKNELIQFIKGSKNNTPYKPISDALK